MTLVMTVAFAALLIGGFPVAYALALSCLAAIFATGEVPSTAALLKMFQPTQSFPLIAIPFFILSGTLMMSGIMGRSLMAFAHRLVGRCHGGLAQVSLVGATVFGGASGSAVASASALGSVMIPWQRRQGYPTPFSAALNSVVSIIDLLIPPSIPMILFALISDVSIGALFVAGIIPGLILAVAYLALCNLIARRRGFPLANAPAARGGWRGTVLPALVMPLLIVGTGVTTGVIMLVVGTFLDLSPAILLLGPIFVPLAQAIGLDLVQLGLIMVLNCAIGMFTPPVGTTLFVSRTIAKVPTGDTIRDPDAVLSGVAPGAGAGLVRAGAHHPLKGFPIP